MQEVFKAKKATVIFTAVFSLFAHAFLFTNEFFSHDSLGYAYSFSREFVTYYAGQGRFGIPLYELVKGNGAAPWLIGILFMLWLSLSAIFVTDMFRISSTMGAVFTGGLLCTNAALTLTGATYIYCLDEYAFALFTVCAAVWTFGRGKWWPVIGIALIAVSLSIYQAYYTVAISLCLIAVINRVLSDEDGMLIFGTKYIAFLVLGFVLYYV
ncbi:MAG: glucosyltransferase domain-containing protein, partial [Oscillospiraceae bacterium]|nr:glucosyltransferase domain-containing protein [Oscillospiraceae bacterium]